MISHEHKCIFIHIPRTGGTSIERSFNWDKEGKKHWNLSRWRSGLDINLFNNYFKFSFVRNPWDFIISKYKAGWFGAIGEKTGKSLKFFLEHYKTPKHECGETFHEYFSPNQMDFIGRFENRTEDISFISKKIGKHIDSKIHVRKIQQIDKNKKHYTEYYDNETREIVATRYSKDIEYFGYNFEGHK